ncbi:hypothetical protein SAMN06296241_1354 [Salinimicrobium sediminis]|uniref:BNR repeat-containing family member n=1 Tax=Salinimicrobium sediminis TaxID=1343891 RepID=A0A285X3A0_9FLAO|nr:hypothetical protein [Salinimicrobium sediminis]SOC79817.1 hypothetical protein SAMN06296241_1354 [Salinimicrobium sediminis]
MNHFFSALMGASGVVNSTPDPVSPDIYDYSLRLNASNLATNSFYFFRPYRTANYSAVVNDKDFFFLYSRDHDSGNPPPGGLYWGKGNNLDLSDFEEGGLILDGNQAETPILLQLGNTLFLYYHTDTSETGNNGKQQTRLVTSPGGNLLHLNTWTDEGRPLGIVGTNDHTGYFHPYQRTNDIIGTHITKGGLPQPWETSISTDGGYTYTRHEVIDVITGTETGYFAQLSDGQYFEKYNQWWWIGTIHPEADSAIFDADKKLILAKASKLGGTLTQQAILNGGAENLRHSVRVWDDSNIAQIYVTNPKTSLYHAKYDLRNLQQYI